MSVEKLNRSRKERAGILYHCLSSFPVKILTYMKTTSGNKCGMRTTLAMPLLIFLTTSLLVKWGDITFF